MIHVRKGHHGFWPWVTVTVPLQNAVTKCHKQGTFPTTETYCSQIWRLGSPRLSPDSVPGEGPFLGSKMEAPSCAFTWWQGQTNSLHPLSQGHQCNSSGLYSHDLVTPHISHLLLPQLWGLGFQHGAFWKDIDMQTTAVTCKICAIQWEVYSRVPANLFTFYPQIYIGTIGKMIILKYKSTRILEHHVELR